MTTRPFQVIHVITRMIVGGAQENTLYTCAMLNPRTYKTTLVTGPQTGSEGSLLEETRESGVDLVILNEMVREINPIKDLIALVKLVLLFRQSKPDIVHTHSSKAGILGRLAAKIARVPIIIHTVHGWSFHDHMSPAIRGLYILLERWTALFSDAIVAVSKRDIGKGLAASIANESKYHLIRSAIPLEEFKASASKRQNIRTQLGIPQNAPVIGNVGRFSAQKNPLFWIDVADEIAKNLDNACFLLVGDGPLRPQVETKLQEKGLEKRFVLTGLRRDVAALMAAMDVFLITSLWEGLPRVIAQAMAIGIPVVAQEVDGIAEIIHNGFNGFICKPGDVATLSSRCMELIENPELCREISQHGRITARDEFNLNKMIKQIDGLYQEILDKKGEKIAE